jgi:GNAT superfamily N-acetyltransferase
MTEPPQDISRHASDDLEIRGATSDDLPAVLGLLSQMHDKPAGGQAHGLEATFRQILASPSRTLLLAVQGDLAVGTLDLFVMANLTRGGRPWAGIENLVVDAGHRRQGIGSALIDVAIDLARQLDCYKLQLVSHERRAAAHDLYRRAEFDAPVHGYRRYL